MGFLKLFFVIIALSFSICADEVPYKIDITRDGKTSTQVAYNFWSGEYPSPVINVHANETGKTTIEGYASLRDKKERKACTVKNGLYHPWAKEENSLINFYTITPVEDYEVVVAPAQEGGEGLGEERLKVGDKILNVIYLAEGISQGTLHTPNKPDTLMDFYSDMLETNAKMFKKIQETNTANIVEQWLYVKCEEGHNVFVEDEDLLSQKGVKEGQITGYGSISP